MVHLQFDEKCSKKSDSTDEQVRLVAFCPPSRFVFVFVFVLFCFVCLTVYDERLLQIEELQAMLKELRREQMELRTRVQTSQVTHPPWVLHREPVG